MLVLKGPFVSSAETGFHSENIGYVYLLEHGNSSRSVFKSIHREPALLEREVITYFGQDVGKYSCAVRLVLNVITVHKDIFTSRVAMQIAVKSHLTVLGEVSYQLFNRKIDRMQDSRWVLPAPVQILTTETAPIVSIYHTVRIEYRDYFKYEMISQGLRLRCMTRNEIYNALHHPRAVRLARMHSSTDEDSLFRLSLYRVWVLIFTGNR